jgi:hypothetical protein
MQCALMEDPVVFESITNVSKLPLPSAEFQFDSESNVSSSATLENQQPGESIYAELLRGFKLW